MKLYILFFIIFLFLSGNISAQTDSIKSAEKTGKITGIAMDSTSGLPVQGALVKLQEINDQLLKYSETDGTGSFTFEGIPYGIYEVQLVKDSYEPTTNTADLNSPLLDLGKDFYAKEHYNQ